MLGHYGNDDSIASWADALEIADEPLFNFPKQYGAEGKEERW